MKDLFYCKKCGNAGHYPWRGNRMACHCWRGRRLMMEQERMQYPIIEQGQSKRDSWIEAWANIIVGFSLNVVLNFVVLPLFGLHPTLGQSTSMALFFTAVSLVRTYMLRRLFNRYHIEGRRRG